MRFFFDVSDERGGDDNGVDLPNSEAAYIEALRMTGQLLMDQAAFFFRQKGLTVSVRDSVGDCLLTVAVQIVNAPVAISVRQV